MTRQRAQYLRRAIPRARAKRQPRWIITGRIPEGDLADIKRRFAAAMQEGRHSPTLIGTNPPACRFQVRPPGFWRSLFGR